MKIAFLIMVHNNPTMLNCFIKQLLQYQGSVVFIHVDEKGLNIIPDIIEDPRVIIIPEHYNGSWGDYSQIQMVNALIKNAVNSGDFDYYHKIIVMVFMNALNFRVPGSMVVDWEELH